MRDRRPPTADRRPPTADRRPQTADRRRYTVDALLLLASALFLGFLHGLGPDHLMAIATLAVDGDGDALSRRARAIGVAVRFALGHALLLAVGAGLIVLVGWSIPERVERSGEMLGGALLIVMGVLTLHLPSRLRRFGKTGLGRFATTPSLHHHHPATAAGAGHHSHLPTMVGAAFAVSSLRALAMLTPFGADLGNTPLPLLLGLIAIFAAGILASMVLFGVLLAGVLSMRALHRVGHGAGALVGVSSVILGVAWVVTA
jgi:nickel/cobalt transporter (NicO) family protein